MLLLLVLVAAVPGLTQDRDAPAKDARPQGILRGRVVAADTGRPVARAQVSADFGDARHYRCVRRRFATQPQALSRR